MKDFLANITYSSIRVFLRKSFARTLLELYFFSHWKKISANQLKTRSNPTTSPRLFWGPTPLLNFKYWNNALREAGYTTQTVMYAYYTAINSRTDFDLYYEEILLKNYNQRFMWLVKEYYPEYFIMDFILKNFDIVHTTCYGLFYNHCSLQHKEAFWFKKFGIKSVVLPHGGDSYQYSKITDVSWRHCLIYHYPQINDKEKEINTNVEYWIKNSDAFIPGYQIDNIKSWTVIPYIHLSIDTKIWTAKKDYKNYNGSNGSVVIVHTPNHRLIKGTEFLVQAVNNLQKEGLQIELILLEGVKNEEVRRILKEKADILVEQLIFGYALSGIEGMATGLPVISNLSYEPYTRLFRRYSYLNECPILSSSPETITDQLRLLVTNPGLRKELGKAGRQFVQKYHSEKFAQFMFGKIYDKIWFNKEVDLLNLFHPALSNSYNNQSEVIKHPLFENKYIPTVNEFEK